MMQDTAHSRGILSVPREVLQKASSSPLLSHAIAESLVLRLQTRAIAALEMAVIEGTPASPSASMAGGSSHLSNAVFASSVSSPEITAPPLCGHRFLKLRSSLAAVAQRCGALQVANARATLSRRLQHLCDQRLLSWLVARGESAEGLPAIFTFVNDIFPALVGEVVVALRHQVSCLVYSLLREPVLTNPERLVEALIDGTGLEELLSEEGIYGQVREASHQALHLLYTRDYMIDMICLPLPRKILDVDDDGCGVV